MLLGAFAAAATRPSWAASIGTILVTTSTLGLAVAFLDESFLAAQPAGVFMESARDDDAYVTHACLRLQRQGPEPSAVAILGSSSTMQVLPDQEQLDRWWSEALGHPAHLHNLCAMGMTIPEYVSVVDRLADVIGGAFVINVSVRQILLPPSRWRDSLERHRIGFHSGFRDQELRRHGFAIPARHGNYFWDHHAFLAPRLFPAALHALTGPLEPVRHLYESVDDEANPGLGIRRPLPPVAPYLNLYAMNKEESFAVLQRIVERIRASGAAEIVLLESTWHSSLRGQFAAADYATAIREFAEAQRVHYWVLDQEAGIRDVEFADALHVGDPEARDRFARTLVRRLADLLGAKPGGGAR